MKDLETSQGRGIWWGVGCALLLLGIIFGAAPAHAAPSVPVDEAHWFRLTVPGLEEGSAVYAVSRSGNLILVGAREQGVFLSRNAGASWEQPVPLRNLYVRDVWLSADGADGADGPVALVATFGGGLWRSADSGSFWLQVNPPGTPYHYSIDAWQGGVQNMLFVGTANNGVWKSSNLGGNWSPTGALGSPGAVALAVVDAQVVYAGSVDNGIFKTENGGANWTPTGFQGHTVRAIALDPDEPSRLLASVLSDGVYRPHYSGDGGAHWTPLDDGLDDASILALSIARVAGERYVLAGAVNQGVFRLDESDGSNPTWRPYGLAGRSIYDLGNFDGTWYAGASGGVWLLRPEAHALWLPLILHSRTATGAQ